MDDLSAAGHRVFEHLARRVCRRPPVLRVHRVVGRTSAAGPGRADGASGGGMMRGASALLGLTLLVACGSPPLASSPSAAAPPPSSAAAEPSVEPAAFDFARTAWRVETIDGQPVAVGSAPTLAFDAREGQKGSGAAFSGCSSFGFQWDLGGGRAEIRPQGVDLGTCTG